MVMETNNKNTPPNLIKGILLATLGTCVSILLVSWLIINYQVEQLVQKRTSEYAHSIARVAADSSAEALLSGDLLQLNLLVKNVAKDPYIRQATIYSEDGQVVTQYPKELLNQPSNQNATGNQTKSAENTTKAIEEYKSDFLRRQKNIPFIEKIAYQEVTGGWFKLEINSLLLEKDFRAIFKQIQLLMASIAIAIFLLLVFFVFKLKVNIDQLSTYCHKLLLQNNLQPAKNLADWIEQLKQLAENKAQQLKEHIRLPSQMGLWVTSQVKKEILLCHLEFEIAQPFTTNIAEQLSLAENFLTQSAQSFGVQSQGDILSASDIPFLENYQGDDAEKDRLKDALSFVTLVTSLFEELDANIQIKSALVLGDILVLEDSRDLITGISIPTGLKQKISSSMLATTYGSTIFIDIPQQIIQTVAKIAPLTLEPAVQGCCQLLKASPKIKQQIQRKQRYILDLD